MIEKNVISFQISEINFQQSDINLKSAFSIFSRKSVYLLVFFVLILCFLLLAFSSPVAAADEDPIYSEILISNETTVLRNGETYRLFQGYEVTVRGFGAENILLEIYCNDSNLSSSYHISNTDLEEGETIQCYRRTENGAQIVFMMTLENMYLNHSEIIAEFSHIYQYNDSGAANFPVISDWIIYTDTLTFPPSNDSDNPNDDKKNDYEFFVEPVFIIVGVALVAILIVLLHFHSNKKK
jgi:hypothetical protein